MTSSRARLDVLRGAFEVMTVESKMVACIIAAENGKTVAEARSEATYAAKFFRWLAEAGVRTESSYGQSPRVAHA